MKTCAKCGMNRPLKMYYTTHTGNHSKKCKVCVIARVKERAAERRNETTIEEICDYRFVIQNKPTNPEALKLVRGYLFAGDCA